MYFGVKEKNKYIDWQIKSKNSMILALKVRSESHDSIIFQTYNTQGPGRTCQNAYVQYSTKHKQLPVRANYMYRKAIKKKEAK